MKSEKVLLSLLMLSCVSIMITIAFYFVNLWLFSSVRYFSPTDAFFIEGVLFLIVGFYLLLGRGGISIWSVRAAILSALAGAVFDQGTVGPDEMLKRDRWKPEGFVRLALILILAGVFMILIYFLVYFQTL